MSMEMYWIGLSSGVLGARAIGMMAGRYYFNKYLTSLNLIPGYFSVL
jgi:hypothetical protein